MRDAVLKAQGVLPPVAAPPAPLTPQEELKRKLNAGYNQPDEEPKDPLRNQFTQRIPEPMTPTTQKYPW